MRKEQAKEWINRSTERIRRSEWNSDYVDGFNEGCKTFLDWLIQQGVIKQ